MPKQPKLKPIRRERRRRDPLAAQLGRMARQTKDSLVRRWLDQLARKGTFRDWTYYGDSGS